ncbi:iron chelate uptake ABC transporter family permease subunit [Ancylobacter sp. Lp-2]|uniref:ABC transporter permease n=1 Tax=Ancylobacter sp. Lp-2 TaxID=2881339 RepID=UPI001E500306|nr:iron chelate uptake ABC transporter family permease subunit [Ancylobacter sp. Lp-2]MCB4769630.1 iron chelate uptake ABC transporter family permease subunit [Ancylobacter sp. Lp-2]
MPPSSPRRPGGAAALAVVAAGLLLLASASLFVGSAGLTPRAVLAGDPAALRLLLASRLPRTLAVLLAGLSLGIAAVLMQVLFRNRFVEPTTAGTADFAGLGLLLAAILAPGLPVWGKMLVATGFALVGTAIFLRIVGRIAWRDDAVVPLIGLMLGGVVGASSAFLAYRFDLVQMLSAWTSGDFSGVLRGRYELLWFAGGVAILAYAAADRFTVAGLGENFSTNLGLDHRATVRAGLAVVALVTASCTVTVGMVPFLGLMVANGVCLVMGDNLRRSLPWIALAGAAFLLLCDMAGRLVHFPYEIPVGTVAGVVGSGLFLQMLLSRRVRLG